MQFETIRPKVIFLVGIAFGVRRRDHRIGDVLVAKHIRRYMMYKAKPETIENVATRFRPVFI